MRTLKRLFIAILLSCSWFFSFSGHLTPEQLLTAASRLAAEKFGYNLETMVVAYSVSDNEGILIRAYNMPGTGFILLSGVDAAYPLLGYSAESSFDGEMSPALEDWLDMYREQIIDLRNLQDAGQVDVHPAWINLLSQNYQPKLPETTSAGPLLTCNWNQGKYYNDFCPADANGPGGKVWAGCVATAMGMAMQHYKYPWQGIGSHSYKSSYGYLSANFGAATYDWFAMENSIDNHYNDEVAELLYHCGVGVDMSYSPNGSGAQMWKARNALVNYFGYSSSASLVYKNSYTDANWKSLMIQQIDSFMPLVYAGYPQGGGSGHAFNLDGYDGTDHFHFNWGWSAAYNGYYYLNSLNPGGNDFTGGQQAIINLKPGSNYPNQCTGFTSLTATRGMVFDGSGPHDYSNNLDCVWKITPGNVEKIYITIDQLSIGDTGDSLIVYNGGSTSDSILVALTADSIPGIIVANADEVTIRFTTNSSLTKDGFVLSYQAVLQDYCGGTTTLQSNSGTISDGSGGDNYRDGTLCKWIIEPQNGYPVKLTFLSMDLFNSSDFVRVYDLGTQPGTILGQFSNNFIPSPVIAASGKMLVLFYADQQGNAGGWEAMWTADQSIGLDEIAENVFTLYPNPAEDYCRLEFSNPDGSEEVLVIDALGRHLPVNISRISEYTSQFDIAGLPAGAYWIRINSNQGVKNQKLYIIH